MHKQSKKPVRIFISVGTDIHPFNRLVSWAESILDQRAGDITVAVQHGATRPPKVDQTWKMLHRAEILEQFKAADLVIVSCGPGAVMDARSVGKLPIVVARDSSLGEHVDGHQQAFGRHLERTGMARNAQSLSDVLDLIDEFEQSPDQFSVTPSVDPPPGIAVFGDRVTRLLTNK